MAEEFNLGALILSAGALGVASFGVVDGIKFGRLGTAGLAKLKTTIGEPLMALLNVAYGDQSEGLLTAQYRNGRSSGKLPSTLRRGVRIGLTSGNAGVFQRVSSSYLVSCRKRAIRWSG